MRLLGLVLAGLLAWAAPAPAAEIGLPPAELRLASADAPALPADWIEVAGPAFVAHGPAEDVELLRELHAHGALALPRLASELGTAIGGTIRVVLTPDDASFRALQPGPPPVWADATAWPGQGLVFLRHPRARQGTARPLEVVLDHELVHVLLGRAFAPARPPSWLQEGAAQVLSGEAGPDTTVRLARALSRQGAIPLEDLERGFPADAHRADLAYAQAADFVGWLRVEHGADTLPRLVRRVREGDGLATAVRRVTGVPLVALDAAWQERLASGWLRWSAPGSLEGALWSLASLAIVGVGWSRRRDRGSRLGAWRTAEADMGRLAREVIALRRSDAA